MSVCSSLLVQISDDMSICLRLTQKCFLGEALSSYRRVDRSSQVPVHLICSMRRVLCYRSTSVPCHRPNLPAMAIDSMAPRQPNSHTTLHLTALNCTKRFWLQMCTCALVMPQIARFRTCQLNLLNLCQSTVPQNADYFRSMSSGWMYVRVCRTSRSKHSSSPSPCRWSMCRQ